MSDKERRELESLEAQIAEDSEAALEKIQVGDFVEIPFPSLHLQPSRGG